MRDAFGGVFMLRLMLVFIVLYVAFTAVSFKYAKSFRIKNKVIDFVEQNQITDLSRYFSDGNGYGIDKIDKVLRESNYNISCSDLGYDSNDIKDPSTHRNIGYCYKGVVIIKNSKSTRDTIYYDVYTYVNWDLGALNTILVLSGKDRNSESPIYNRWRITGEAIVVNK